MVSKQDIFSISDIKTRDVEVPEWNTTLKVASLSGKDRSALKELSDKLVKQGKDTEVLTWSVIFCAVDDNGKRIFDFADFDKLHEKSAMAIDRISKAALIVNGFAQESIDEAKKN